MKTMTCRQLGGACDLAFHADTFETMAELSKQHGMEMRDKQDEAHLEAMREMGARMKNPEDMENWYAERQQEFEALPDSESR